MRSRKGGPGSRDRTRSRGRRPEFRVACPDAVPPATADRANRWRVGLATSTRGAPMNRVRLRVPHALTLWISSHDKLTVPFFHTVAPSKNRGIRTMLLQSGNNTRERADKMGFAGCLSFLRR